MYCDFYSVFSELTDVEAGQLIKHVLAYVNDENPVSDNRLINIAFQPIKMQLKRDLTKWESIIEKRSNAGKISADKRKQTKSTHVKSVTKKSTHSTVNDNVTVNVNDNVTVNEKDCVISDKSQTHSFKKFSQKDFTEDIAKYSEGYNRDLLNNFFSYWKENSPGGKMKFQLEKTWETKLRLEKWKSNQHKFEKNEAVKNINGAASRGIKNDSAYEFLKKISGDQ